jgi:hypothetical protein
MYRRQRENSSLNNIPTNTNVSLVTEAEANQGGAPERVMSVNAIPDIILLSTLVIDFVEYYNLPSTKKLKNTNYGMYLNTLYDKFEKLPTSMIKLLSDDDNQVENLEKIINMLETLSSVKRGEVNLETAHDEFTEKQNEAYFYPAFGGKEKLMQDIKDKGGDVDNVK